MKSLFNLFTLFLILALFALPAMAQESAPAESPAPVSEELPAWAMELGYGTLLVTALIGLGKYIPFLQNVPIERQKIALVVLLLLAHLYVKENGDLASFSAKIGTLGELATRLVAFAGMYFGSAAVHEASGSLPLLGNGKPQASNERPAM